MTHFRMPVKLRTIFGPCRETSYTAITLNQSQTLLAERRVILYSTEVHWRNQNYSYEFGCQAGVAHWWLLECRWVERLVWFLGQVSLNLLCWKKNFQKDICGLGGEINKKTAYIQARSSMARALEVNGKACQAEGRSKSGLMKSSIWRTHENCKGSLSLTRRTRNSKRPSRMRARSWKHQWLLLCPVKIMKNCGSGVSNKKKTKLACILEADESPRMRMGNSIPHHHEDHIAGKRLKIHYSTTIWFTSLFLCLKLWKFRQRKQRWTRNEKNWRKFRHGTWRKSEVKKRWSMKHGPRAQKVHFASLMDICHLKTDELEAKHQKYKGRVVLRGDIVKTIQGLMQYSTERGSSASQMTAAKVMDIISWLRGCDGQAADAVSAYTHVKMEDASKLLKIPKSECPHIWIRLPRHTWPRSWSSMEDPVVPLERNLYGHLLAGLLCERQFEKTLIAARLGKGFQLGTSSLYIIKKKIFLICVCGWRKIGWKETKSRSDVESTQQRIRFGRTNIFLGSCILGMHSKTMPNKQRYCGQLRNHVRIANFSGESREITIPSKSFVFLHGLMTWLVMQRSVWNDIVSWRTRRRNNSTKYLLHALRTTISKKKKRHLLEIFQKYALKLFWNAFSWHELEDQIFCGQWKNLVDGLQNGPKLVTNAWIDWFHIFIIRVNTGQFCHVGNSAKQCRLGLASRLWLRGRSWRFKIHFWRNIVRFGKSYVRSNKLDVKSSFTNTELVWWSMESLFGCRRRIETKISVLLW